MSEFVYDTKIIQSGDIVEIYKYKVPIKTGQKMGDRKPREKTEKVINENNARSTRRTRQEVIRLVNSNFDKNTSFLTLTFAENIKDIEVANYEFKKFKQKLERLYKKENRELKYLGVIEFQDGKFYKDKNGEVKKGTGRGAVHYHLLLFNAPYIDWQLLQNKWGNGFITINKCDDIDNMGAYISKYMTEDINDPRLKGKRRYFASYKTLTKYETSYIDFNVNIYELFPKKNLVLEHQTIIDESDYKNEIIYLQYNLNREKNKYKRLNRLDFDRKEYYEKEE